MKHQSLNKYITVLLLSISFVSGRADSLADIVDRIMAANPAVPAATTAVTAQILTAQSLNDISLPSIDVSHLWSSNNIEGDKTNVSVMQDIPFPGLIQARNKLATETAHLARQRADARINDIRLQTFRAVSDLIYAIRVLNLTDSICRDAHIETTAYEKGFSDGSISILDLNQIRLTEAEIQSELITAQNAVTECRNVIDRMADSPGFATTLQLPTEIQMPTLPTLDQCLDVSLSIDPEYAEIYTRAIESGLMASTTNEAKYGSLALGYNYARENHTSFNGFAISYTLPSTGDTRRARAARADNMSAVADQQLVEAQIRQNILNKLNEAQSLLQSINIINNALASSDHLYLLKRAYEGGEITLEEYLESRRQAFRLMIQRENNMAKYCNTVFSLTIPE